MIIKTFVVFLIIQLFTASLGEKSSAAAVKLHERTLIPGALVPLPEIAASTKGLHLSVTTGTPGARNLGKRFLFVEILSIKLTYIVFYFLAQPAPFDTQSPSDRNAYGY